MKSNITVLITLITLAVILATVSAFTFAFAASTIVASPSTANGFYPNGMTGNDWNGMSGMMGGNWNPSSTVQTSAVPLNTVLPLIGFVTLIGAALTGVGGAVYFLKVPKIGITEPDANSVVSSLPQKPVTAYESVSKTLTTEERTVLDILVSHDGKYLQKYIRAETGLSRLKVHRIVSRLAERGIVTLKHSGNTNEVHVSNWLQNKPYSNIINCKQAENQELTVEA